ncbi:MAG: IS66 family transposase [Rubrivivax sp.]
MTAAKLARILQVSMQEVELALQRAKATLSEKDFELLKALADSYAYLSHLVEGNHTTIAKLRKMLFGTSNEKTAAVLGAHETESTAPASGEQGAQADPAASKPAQKGHGRNGADQYRSASRTKILNEAAKVGAKCPEAECKGILYKMAEPSVIVRVIGGPPLQAHVWELERLRCNLCGVILTAKGPAGLGTKKYDETAASMIGLMRYGIGVPFHRLEQLEHDLGVPLPASTQWDIAAAAAEKIEPVFEELIRQAAQGDVVHNDDTPMTVLALQAELRANAANDDASDKRKGTFTTGIVSIVEDRRIGLFFTGRKHAGENLADLLKKRAADRPPPMQMCDGLLHNLPKEFEVILGNCTVHARRQFVDVFDAFPEKCRHVLECFAEVYRHDATAKAQGMSPKDRLAYHQTNSGPVMDKLKQWLDSQLAEGKEEPNGGFGRATRYVQKRWEPLTLFLRRPGAPLDNNICEQALKRAVIHRKNSLFYKTENGARVGDTFMSLIHTAKLCGANPFDYLTELQRNDAAVAKDPAAWLPWNYLAALAAAGPAAGIAAR